MYRKYSTVSIFNGLYELCFMLLLLCTVYVLKSVVYHWSWLMVATACTLTRTGIWEYNKSCGINGTLFTAEVIHLSSKCVSLLSGLTTQFDCLQPIWKKPKPQKMPISQKKKKKPHQSNVSIFKKASSGNVSDLEGLSESRGSGKYLLCWPGMSGTQI